MQAKCDPMRSRSGRVQRIVTTATALAFGAAVPGFAAAQTIENTGTQRRHRESARSSESGVTDAGPGDLSTHSPRLVDASTAGGLPAAGAPGTAASVGVPTLVYQNVGPISSFKPRAGIRIFDDVRLAGTNRKLASYNVCVIDTVDTFDVTMELWTDNGSGSAPLSPIAGTECSRPNNLPGVVKILYCDPTMSGIILPDQVWLAVTFSTSSAAWVVAGEAEVGVTNNYYYDTSPPARLTVVPGGYYSGFCAEIWAEEGPCPATECLDADPCNGVESCNLKTGQCVAGTPLNCDDGNQCTDDTCNPEDLDGDPCVREPVPNGTVCDDAEVCTVNDQCVDGVCEDPEPECVRGACCYPGAGCADDIRFNDCRGQDGAPMGSQTVCEPALCDLDQPCEHCGAAPHWVHACAGGLDRVPSSALVGIDLNFDCIADTSLLLSGPVTIQRSPSKDASPRYPEIRPTDGHFDVIDTEIVAMYLTGGGTILRAGSGGGQGAVPLLQSNGAIFEETGAPEEASSFFDVFFEVDLGGGLRAYNHDPARVQTTITCVPPDATYLHLAGCFPLYDRLPPGTPGAIRVANLVTAKHDTFPTPPVDRWVTCREPGQLNSTYHDFSAHPIPADFFDPGSEPFDGRVQFGPASILDPSNPRFTGIRRSGDPVLPTDPAASMGTVSIEIVELDLISAVPIIVTYGTSRPDELWQVEVGLSTVPQPSGMLTATKTHANGGTFDSILPVQPLLRFLRDSDGAVRMLDTGLEALPPLVLEGTASPFVHSVNPNLEIVIEPGAVFVPGVEESIPGDPASQRVRSVVEGELLAQHTVCPPSSRASKFDRWATWRASGSSDQNYHDFGSQPIPSGFFDLGSATFDERIELKGAPLDPPTMGDADTMVKRSADPFSFVDPTPTTRIIEVEIAELSLISVNPIVVRYDNGQPDELWDIRVGLSSAGQPLGTLEARKTDCNGGTFISTLPVLPHFIARRRTDGELRMLDGGLAGMPPLMLNGSGNFVMALDAALDLVVDEGTEFVPGVFQQLGCFIPCLEPQQLVPCSAMAELLDDDPSPNNTHKVPSVKNRYLSFQVEQESDQAIQITFKKLPVPWNIWDGSILWVTGPIQQVTEIAGITDSTPPAFNLVSLGCNAAGALYTDWSTYGVVHVWHPGFVPGGEYEVRVVQQGKPSPVRSYSAELLILSPPWGDLTGPFDTGNGGIYTAPDGRVDVTVDVTAVLGKFANRSGSPDKVRSDLEPCRPDRKINISDVSWVLNAFRSLPFPYRPDMPPGAGNCSSTDVCSYAAPSEAATFVTNLTNGRSEVAPSKSILRTRPERSARSNVPPPGAVAGGIPTQVVETVTEEEPRARHTVCPPTRRMKDYWSTWRTGVPPEQSFQTFANRPIPADFFDPGSEPFDGVIEFQGLPLDPTTTGDADTIVERVKDPILPSDPPETLEIVSIELVALHLGSVNPITVTYNTTVCQGGDASGDPCVIDDECPNSTCGSRAAESWAVDVSVSNVRAPPGNMVVIKEHDNGGTFSSTLPVQPRLTFIRASDGAIRVLDTGEAGWPPILLSNAGAEWVHAVNPALGLVLDPSTSFVPGVREPVPGDLSSQQPEVVTEEESRMRHTVCRARVAP